VARGPLRPRIARAAAGRDPRRDDRGEPLRGRVDDPPPLERPAPRGRR
jgi:hypothetical protein